jgi:hypothetical protein
MGFGSSFKKTLGKVTSTISGGVGSVLGDDVGGALQGIFELNPLTESGIDAINRENRNRALEGLPSITPEQITAANVFKKLTPEQQKDILINNPNIITSQGEQIFDPLTNTIRLKESEFQTGQRGRQEQLAQELSGQLIGQTLPGTDPTSRFESGRKLLAPAFEEQRERLEQQLADQGIPRGSKAHQKELDRLERSQGTQLSSLARESVATSEAQRTARFNEISSLLGQQQVGGVGFGGFQPGFSGVDVSGQALSRDLQQSQLAFQGEQARKDRSLARTNALIGAGGQLGAATIGAAGQAGGFSKLFSDRSLKKNIETVGESESGIPIYKFDYINKVFGEGRYEGVMAQDLQELKPEAVIELDSGTLMVDYSKIDVNFRRVN